MDDLSRKFRGIDWKSVQKSVRKVQASTASALKDMVMTDLENKTRAATADTAWGASGTDLMSIAQGSYRREDYALIMSIVWQRLTSSRWRCVYKTLELLKFLIMHGTARCSEEGRVALPHLRALTDYVAIDNNGRDVADGVRSRAALVCEMLSDESVLETERARSRELRAKLQGGSDFANGRMGGMSSDDYRQNMRRTTAGVSDYGYGSSSTNANASAQCNVSTNNTGTATFKGYGDDDDADVDTGHYNTKQSENNSDDTDRPYEGQFRGYNEAASPERNGGDVRQGSKALVTVDDLLGGEDAAAFESNAASGISALDELLGSAPEALTSNKSGTEGMLGAKNVSTATEGTAMRSGLFVEFQDGDMANEQNKTSGAESNALGMLDDILGSRDVNERGSNGLDGLVTPTNNVQKPEDDDDDFNPRGEKTSNGADKLDWL